MRLSNIILPAVALLAIAVEAKTPVYKQKNAPVEARVADLLGRMTPEEKAGQLLCPMGWEMYVKNPDGSVTISEKFREMNSKGMPVGSYWAVLRADPWTQKTLTNGLWPEESAKALNALQKYMMDSTRLGIPILFAEEAVHGHMAIGTTVLPTGLGMASTWNPELVREAGTVAGREVALQGATVGYGPVLDIARDPRWSRMEETMGEDPWLAGEIGTAYMDGMQRHGQKGARPVYSTLKHFAAYGVPEAGLNGRQANVGMNQLLSELLGGFKKAVENGAGSVMTSYNTIDGIPATGHKYLLDEILRKQWGFEGVVFSDLFSIDGMMGKTADSKTEAGAQALRAGVDLDLGAACYGPRALEALDQGLITMAELDTAVARVLRMKFLAGLFDQPYVDPKVARKEIHTAVSKATAREVARQGTVLLKNNGMLPLAKNLTRIAVIGPNANEQYNQLGDYTAPQPEDAITTVLEGVREAVGPSTEVVYVKGCAIRDTTETDIPAAVKAAQEADAVILVVGGSSARDFKTEYAATGAATGSTTDGKLSDMDCGEGFDRATLSLLGKQNELMEQVLATGKPVAVVYIQGRPLDMTTASDKADALLCAWYPGAEGGAAIADIIFGDYNPSGRLPVTVPRSSMQVPLYYSQGARPNYIDMTSKPLYPFGYGLSYTDFRYDNLSIEPTDGKDGVYGTAKVTLTNTGKRAGAEVVQLYIHDVKASVAQPPLLLKGFRRVELAPGETKTVSFPLTADELAIYTQDLRHVVEPGDFTIMAGGSSDNLPLKGKLTVN